jgi:transposase
MAARHARGESSAKIGKRYGCCNVTILNLLKQYGYWNVNEIRPVGYQRYHFTDRQIADMAERHAGGASSREVAEPYGCSPQTVTRLLKDHGYWDETLRYKTQTTLDQQKKMAERYQAGESLNALARDYGCTAGNIRHLILKQGVETRPLGRAPIPPETLDWIRQQRAAGVTHQSIADTLGFQKHHIIGVCRKLGLPRDPRMSGPEHHAWKGGRYVDGNGYVQVWVDPQDPMASMATTSGHVPEHRLVMARSLGRPLTSTETVHHVNSKDKTDNRLEKLQLRQGAHGKGSAMQCLDCGSHNIECVPLK